MRKIFSVIFSLISVSCCAQIEVKNLLTENAINPMGIDIVAPGFSWQIIAAKRNTMQTAYELIVSEGTVNQWSSDKIASAQSRWIPYAGRALQSEKKYSWRVRVWDNQGNVSNWSEPASFQMGLLQTGDWKAVWISSAPSDKTETGIGASKPDIATTRIGPLFRHAFTASKKIISATALITAHGLYEAYMNGQRIGDAYLTPGWTSYNKRLQYQTYDVTKLIKKGRNAIGVMIGNGWYRGYLGWDGDKNIFGDRLALLFQLDIRYSDGSKESIVSDGSWKSSTGGILNAELYNGETFDAQKEKSGWLLPDYKEGADWMNAQIQNDSKDNLVSTISESVAKHETFKPLRIFKTPKGEQVIDFGQNLVGWVIMKVNGKAGDTISIQHAEVLDKQGNFYTENLRTAKAKDIYILKGGGEETHEPHFTFHGFRYIKIDGYPGEIKPEDFTAVTLYSDMAPTGSFTCSNALVNQLQHNIQWGQKGNFVDLPTDCPQRDERLGWTGDAQVFSRTASFNMNVDRFFAKWMKDVAADQSASGSVPFVVPNTLGEGAGGSAGWGDVATIVPWNMYLAYGDRRMLEEQYHSMKAWVDYISSRSTNDLWNKGFHFGDWLFYRPDDDNDGRAAVTNKYLIAQCFYAGSTQLLINTARVLNKTADATKYSSLLQKIKDAFIKEYSTPNGALVSGTQTAYVLALHFNMLPDSLRAQAAQRLVENIKSYGNHLTTGFLGTPYLCDVLTRFGYSDIAYDLLLQETYPSWLYPVKMGATTIWERWDGIKPDSTFELPSMNSFNHYSYGAIGDWLYRSVAGLDTYEDGPGYKHIKIQPHIGGGLTNASASLLTGYGKLSSAWTDQKDKITMDVEIPPNTTADIYIPALSTTGITESGLSIGSSGVLKITGKENGYIIVQTGSGTYHFEVMKK